MRRTRTLTTTAALVSGGLLLSFGATAPSSSAVPDVDGTEKSNTKSERRSAIHESAAKGGKKDPKFDFADTVKAKAVMDRLEDFQEIADANDGNRAVGTPGYEASGKYVEQTLRAAGYATKRQYFSAEQYSVDAFSLTVTGVPLEPIVMSYSSSTPEGGVTGDLVAPADPLGCDAAAWDGVDAAGGIAVVSRGACSFAEKAAAAGAADAAGVIVYNNTEGALNGTLGGTLEGSAPAVGVTQAEGQSLLDAMAQGPVEATLNIQAAVSTTRTFNVIAQTRTGDTDNVVMLGAHLDGVEDGAGINDNGSGSAAILETAVQLAKATGQDKGRSTTTSAVKGAKDKAKNKGPKNKCKKDKGPKNKGLKKCKKPKPQGPKMELENAVRFAWWGAEEIGLVGSTHYVDNIVENNPERLDQISSYLNFDMIGSINYTVGVYDADESTYEAPVEVPEGSAELEAVFTDYFDDNGQPWVDSEYSGRSDYQAFIENGVPAGGLFSGADAIKTEEEAEVFGGTAGRALDPNYHSANDDIDNISRAALEIFVPAIAHSVQDLAAKQRRR
ncbi:M28 family peptidase [Nocardioides sambongensis]|uniref:M28 family peptidase n=1 Tax=Nocardioides sambongensis TaxID=2589074 RepID=UPI0011278E64|nr:M28 family peptidase [Nocardioides sambongensis]